MDSQRPPPPELTLEIVSAIDDQLAFNLLVLRRPAIARIRRRRELVLIASAPLSLVIGVLFAWLLDPHRVALLSLPRFLFANDPAEVIRYGLGAFVLMGILEYPL